MHTLLWQYNTQNGTLNTGKNNITTDVAPLDAEMIFAKPNFIISIHAVAHSLILLYPCRLS